MRYWIVGGGTGGHVYPALAVARALRGTVSELATAPATETTPTSSHTTTDVTITWIGTASGMERDLVAREGVAYIGIPGGGLHGVALLNAIRNGWDLVRGGLVAARHMRRERPDAVLTTGGYVSGPVALAARSQRVPLMVFVPDVEPAQSVKVVALLASRVAVTVAESRRYLHSKKVVVTGYPLGDRILRWHREAAREALSLPGDGPVLLVFGGSRGARSINRAVLDNLDALTRSARVLHITGTLDWPQVLEALGQRSESFDTIEAAKEGDQSAAVPSEIRSGRYRAFPYLHGRMGAALAAADLVVSRAGASVLGEFPYFGLPSVLVPYPHAWRYQRVNAGWLEDRGAAVVVEDADLPEAIATVVSDLFADSQRLDRMAAASRALARPDAAKTIARQLQELGQG